MRKCRNGTLSTFLFWFAPLSLARRVNRLRLISEEGCPAVMKYHWGVFVLKQHLRKPPDVTDVKPALTVEHTSLHNTMWSPKCMCGIQMWWFQTAAPGTQTFFLFGGSSGVQRHIRTWKKVFEWREGSDWHGKGDKYPTRADVRR